VPFVAPAEGKIKLSEVGPAGDDEQRGPDEWEQPECPRLRANIFSRLTFSWMSPMMYMGVKKFLTEEDLWSLPVRFLALAKLIYRAHHNFRQPDDTAHALGSRLEQAWQARRDKVARKSDIKPSASAQEPTYSVLPADGKAEEDAPKPSLTGALVSSYGGPFFMAAVFKVRIFPQIVSHILSLTSIHFSQLLQDCLGFVQPQLLRRLLQFVSTYNTPQGEPAFHGYLIALSMFVCAVSQTVSAGVL